MIKWMQGEYRVGDIVVRKTPEEHKNWKVLRDERTLQQKVDGFLARYKKEEPPKVKV